MDQSADTNAAIWQSEEFVRTWTTETEERERNRAAQRRLMASLLPFGEQLEDPPPYWVAEDIERVHAGILEAGAYISQAYILLRMPMVGMAPTP